MNRIDYVNDNLLEHCGEMGTLVEMITGCILVPQCTSSLS